MENDFVYLTCDSLMTFDNLKAIMLSLVLFDLLIDVSDCGLNATILRTLKTWIITWIICD